MPNAVTYILIKMSFYKLHGILYIL